MMTGKFRSFLRLAKRLPCLCLVFGLAACAEGETNVAKTNAGKQAARENIFTNSNVLRIRIQIPREGMAALRSSQGGFGQWGGRRTTVRAAVREGDRVYTNVALHLKGAAGSFRPVDDTPGLTLNFDKFAEGQNFHGLKKISLNNSVQDPSYLSEKICRELFEAAGVPVPRAGHAKVELNGRNLGLYVLTEGFNKQFLKRYFKNPKGNLYDGGFVKEITDGLAVNSGDNPRDHSGLQRLAEAATEPDQTKRLARLEQVLDVDRFLSMIAMEVIQCHWDGYAMNKNNFRVYHDLDSNRMVFMPHGMDQMFGVERSSPKCPITPPMQGLVARAVVRTPEGRRRYLERMSQLVTNVFDVKRLTSRVDELAAQIRPVIAENDPQLANYHDQQVEWLKQRIVQRGDSLRQQLGAPTKAVRFDASRVVPLTDWKAQMDLGNPALGQGADKSGKTVLHISAANGNCAGSWRTRVLLERGSYRFEGNVKTAGVIINPADARDGVCLRLSREKLPKKMFGTTEWVRTAYDFVIQDALADIELVCELRAAAGEAWFDTKSLRLIRK
jgi:hypothetical protein